MISWFRQEYPVLSQDAAHARVLTGHPAFTVHRPLPQPMDTARQRLARSFLAGSTLTSGRDVVRALGAVQAQDYDGAKWALSMRTSGATDTSIEGEFAAGRILRTHVLRPTWHFVDPADIRWMLALTGPRIAKTMASYDRKLELDETVYRRSHAAIEKALRGGVHLTRTELKAILAPAGVGSLGVQRAAHLMMRAELDGLICSGPRRGKQFTYALLDERVPPETPIDRDEALLRLTRSYFRSRSPATASDFGWWSGLAMVDVRRGLEIAAAELEKQSVDGDTYWSMGTNAPRSKASAHLLPNYDEFFIGYRNRSAIGKRLRSVKAVTGGSALIANVVAMDGQLVGGWRRTVERDRVTLQLKLLTSLSAPEQKRLLREVGRYASFVERPVELRGLGARRLVPAGNAMRD